MNRNATIQFKYIIIKAASSRSMLSFSFWAIILQPIIIIIIINKLC